MKKEIVIERIFQVLAIGLGAVAVAGIVAVVVQAALGNVVSTTAFEF